MSTDNANNSDANNAGTTAAAAEATATDTIATGAENAPEWLELTDLARRDIGGAVIWADDEAFAEKENLITPGEPVFDPNEFGHKGKVYDGWETRRRREAGSDSAIVRLGVAGAVAGVVVDTAFFLGNYPPEVSVEGVWAPGYQGVEELQEKQWVTMVNHAPLSGGTKHYFDCDEAAGPFTHLRLTMHPDGGIARFRVHGTPCPDPRYLRGTVDAAAADNGGRVIGCSNLFYSSPNNLLARGLPINMGGGWENARRRGEGNDYVEIALAGETDIDWVELDTSWFVHNAPGAAQISARRNGGEWEVIVPKRPLQPDTRHRFLLDYSGNFDAEETAGVEPVAHPGRSTFDAIRIDVYPDGGMARVRVMGSLTNAALEDIASRRPQN